MKKYTMTLPCILAAFLVSVQCLMAQPQRPELTFYDVRELGLPLANQGFKDCVKDLKTQGAIYYDTDMRRVAPEKVQPDWPVTDGYYSRLSAGVEKQVRDIVWDLAQNSTGITVRFRTASRQIAVKWTLLSNFRMNHMSALGICGMDLYAYDNGRWRFVGSGQPSGKESEAMLLSGTDGKERDYALFLPLYDGVIKMSLGVEKGASIDMPSEIGENLFGGKAKTPLVFYGTSGTQGGCASRPGMVFTNILSRSLGRECINLGFSANGRMDSIIAEEMTKIDAGAYILDCMANCTLQGVRDSSDTFIRTLATAHPETPIIMLSSYPSTTLWINKERVANYDTKDDVWRSFYVKFREEGFKNIIYIDLKGTHNPDNPAEGSVTGPDSEYTVDGGHFSDIGFQRIADFLYPYLKDLK